MPEVNHMVWRILFGLLTLCVAGGQSVAFGQTEAAEAATEVHAAAPPNQAHAENVERQINQIAYGRFANAAAARARLEQLLGLRLENIERVCGISETQRKKFELAGKGDIKRFFDAIDEKRRRIRAEGGGQQIDRIEEELSASARWLDTGVFEERSLFVKTVMKTLSADQVTRYQADGREARAFRHQAQVEGVVGIFDQALGLDNEQRRRLKKLLLVQTRSLKIAADHGAEYLFVLAQAVNVSESKLGPIFTKAQRGSANRFTAELKKSLASELKDFESAERGAMPAEDRAADTAVKPDAPKSAATLDNPANTKNQ